MPPAEPLSIPAITPFQRRIVLVGMMCGVSLAAIDQMVLATAVGTIAGELGDMSQAPWIFTANLLASAASMPIWGKLGDLYGRRRVFLSAVGLFIVASLLAAQSRSMSELLFCRGLQGLGGGALLTMPYAILADVVAPRERPAYVAFVTVVWTVAGMLGPPLGGLIVDGPGWRWMFYLNVPAALAAFGLLQWGYRIPRERLEHRVDFPGAALLFCAVGALILYTSWAGRAFGWGAPGPLGLLAASFALGAGFFAWERRAAEPIVELGRLVNLALVNDLWNRGWAAFRDGRRGEDRHRKGLAARARSLGHGAGRRRIHPGPRSQSRRQRQCRRRQAHPAIPEHAESAARKARRLRDAA